MFFITEIHARQDEYRTHQEPRRDLLMQQPPSEDDGGDGVKIDPVGSNDSTKFADDPIPYDVTTHRSNNTQEEKVEKNWRIEKLKDWSCEYPTFRGYEQVIGNNGQQTIEEHLARDEECGITLCGRFDQQRINSPTETGAESKCIAQGWEM